MPKLSSLVITIAAALAICRFSADAHARGFRVDLIPNGSVNNCANCHDNPAGGGARTLFGEDVNGLVGRGSRDPFWTAEFAAEDSDDDGFTNGAELGDFDGDGVVERTVNISFPGDPNLAPQAALGDCNLDTELNATDLACVADVDARDAVLGALNTLPGDLDGDGQVGFPDFLGLSANFGSDSPRYTDGNIDLNGSIGFPDFLTLSANFGQTPAAAESTSAVPEPSGFLLAWAGLLGMLRLRKNQRGTKPVRGTSY